MNATTWRWKRTSPNAARIAKRRHRGWSWRTVAADPEERHRNGRHEREETEDERVTPEERTREERESLVAPERPQDTSGREGVGDPYQREEDPVRALRAAGHPGEARHLVRRDRAGTGSSQRRTCSARGCDSPRRTSGGASRSRPTCSGRSENGEKRPANSGATVSAAPSASAKDHRRASRRSGIRSTAARGRLTAVRRPPAAAAQAQLWPASGAPRILPPSPGRRRVLAGVIGAATQRHAHRQGSRDRRSC